MITIFRIIFLNLSAILIIILITILIRYIFKKNNERYLILTSIVFILCIISLFIGVVNTPVEESDSKKHNKNSNKLEEKKHLEKQNKENDINTNEQSIQQPPSSEEISPNNIEQPYQEESSDYTNEYYSRDIQRQID